MLNAHHTATGGSALAEVYSSDSPRSHARCCAMYAPVTLSTAPASILRTALGSRSPKAAAQGTRSAAQSRRLRERAAQGTLRKLRKRGSHQGSQLNSSSRLTELMCHRANNMSLLRERLGTLS